MQHTKTCIECGDEIMRVVVNDLRIVDFGAAGRCPACASERGMTANEAMDSFASAMRSMSEMSHDLREEADR